MLTRRLQTLDSSNPPHPEESKMELLVVLLFGLVIVAGTATVRAVLKDGHGHTPVVRSTESWNAGNLPSEPYSAPNAWYLPGAWMR